MTKPVPKSFIDELIYLQKESAKTRVKPITVGGVECYIVHHMDEGVIQMALEEVKDKCPLV